MAGQHLFALDAGIFDSMTTEIAVLTTDGADLSTARRVVAIARSWIGTPYHHQACRKGTGCDCLGLVRGVYAELYGQVPETPPPYTRDLAEASQRETLLEAARRHLDEFEHDYLYPGDVVVFRIRRTAMAKHCAIVSIGTTGGIPPRMIHAFEGAPVCEVSLSSWWYRHIAAKFRFPKEPRKWR